MARGDMITQPRPVGTLADDCIRLLAKLRHVTVDGRRVEAMAGRFAAEPASAPMWDHPAFPALAGPDLDAVIWLGSAINFCHWVEPGQREWSVEIGGLEAIDAFAAFAAVHRAVLDGIDIGDARTLGACAQAIVDVGDHSLPLAEKRVAHLREIAALLALEFGGRLENAVAAAGTSAPEHAAFLARTFPSFRDERTYRGVLLRFSTRAQLAAGMLHSARLARGADGLSNTGHLTVRAGYMLPRILRDLGLLDYSPGLTARIEALRRIPASSDEEAEIRIATIAATTTLIRRARAMGSELTALEVEHQLWHRAFFVNAPHHRTLTSDY